MCLIIKSNQGFSHLSQQIREEIYYSNPDGFGFMYYSEADGGLVVEKDLLNISHIDLILDELPDDRTVFVHWRMSTSGQTSPEMAHPYAVHDNLAMMHNGVMTRHNPASVLSHYKWDNKLQKNVPVHKRKTDTNDTLNFINSWIKPTLSVNEEAWMEQAFIKKTEKEIGHSNKLVFMDGNGYWTIYNYEEWTEWNGMLFSNEYAWPADECVYGIKRPGSHFFHKDGDMPSWSNTKTPETTGIGKSSLYAQDLEYMDWDDIYSACVNAPEAVADMIYYDILQGHSIFLSGNNKEDLPL